MRVVDHRVYDVAILSDLRYPGGNAASIVAEVRAHVAAGLTTVLIHVPAPELRHARPFESRIVACLRDGLADLADDDAPIAAKVLLIRRPRIFAEEPATVPKVEAGHVIVALDQAPGDDVRARIERLYGPAVVWAPISGQVREDMLGVAPGLALPETDWHEIIELADWQVEPRPHSTVPVLGRHGGADLPEEPGVQVRLLVESGAESPREFLGTLDFFVHFPDPERAEASGRTILEAMAAGVPVIASPRFRSVFAEAAAYTHPGGVRDLALRLHKDRPAYEALAARARSFVTEQFGSASHIARLASLGVLTRGVVPAPRAELIPSARPARRILFVGDDIARFRAIARRLPAELEPIVVAGSAGLPAAHAAGLLTEYLPAAAELGVAENRWAGFVRDRLRHLIELYDPRAVLVGGVPHDGIAAAIEQNAGPRWLWLRPAMWRRGTGGQWAARGALFAGILEPGEFAAGGDEGWTTTARAGVSTVGPITELPLKPRRRSGGNALLCRGVVASLPGFTVAEARPGELGGITVAVSRADYTNFHELLGAAVPTVFVPDPDGADDELARARFAAAAGVAICATDDDAAAAALEHLADPATREALSRRCAELSFGNGAADAAAWLAGHCREQSETGAGSVR
ncbi:glycosyltransferase [Paractinoplanes lichenicola]|uniref:Glycosyltransferase n=1 Tax=Paractinoplanes lichenicola TaxID=2802976 RepID=A0ABS1W5I3_9ACTN|nr:glycosyltransferase [Actinoplanes lichenicola]MBL7262001.1 glycosyltransferase [Actinoplanes lichenicola]